MEETNREDLVFMKRLNKHPHLKVRMNALLNIAEAAVSNGEMTADEAEIQLQEHVRAMGQEALQDWAISAERYAASRAECPGKVKKHGKKNFTGIQPLE